MNLIINSPKTKPGHNFLHVPSTKIFPISMMQRVEPMSIDVRNQSFFSRLHFIDLLLGRNCLKTNKTGEMIPLKHSKLRIRSSL